MKKQFNYIDIFSGAGGLSLGLFQAGLHGVFAIEKNHDAFSTLEHNLINNKEHFSWPKWLTRVNHDINEVIVHHKADLESLKGTIDLLAGGPPCQGFSLAGVRNHTDIRNTLVYSYIDMVRLVEPNYIFFENVTGFKVKFKTDEKSKPYSEIVKESLVDMGYIVKAYTITMSDYGVPQKRKRFILVGSKIDPDFADLFEDRLLQNRDSFLKEKGLKRKSTVIDAIGDLLQSNGVVSSPDSSSKFKNGKYGKATRKYQQVMRVGTTKIPNSHRFANHTPEIIELHKKIQAEGRYGKRIAASDNLIPNLKRRGVTLLDPKGFSPTVTSIPDELVHYLEPRILSPRETARLQSFPDWYEFKGKYTSGGKIRKNEVPRYTQIGNAVPPLFAEQVGRVFLKYAKTLEELKDER